MMSKMLLTAAIIAAALISAEKPAEPKPGPVLGKLTELEFQQLRAIRSERELLDTRYKAAIEPTDREIQGLFAGACTREKLSLDACEVAGLNVPAAPDFAGGAVRKKMPEKQATPTPAK